MEKIFSIYQAKFHSKYFGLFWVRRSSRYLPGKNRSCPCLVSEGRFSRGFKLITNLIANGLNEGGALLANGAEPLPILLSKATPSFAAVVAHLQLELVRKTHSWIQHLEALFNELQTTKNLYKFRNKEVKDYII